MMRLLDRQAPIPRGPDLGALIVAGLVSRAILSIIDEAAVMSTYLKRRKPTISFLLIHGAAKARHVVTITGQKLPQYTILTP